MDRFVFRTKIPSGPTVNASAFLSAGTGLSRSKIKDAMNKGAVCIKRRGKTQRLRKATASLNPGDYIEFHYDEEILSLEPPAAACLADFRDYSVWFKPPGMMTQGTSYGDHCSLLRRAAQFFQPIRKVFPVHRLDREASGIMIVAHSSEAAARLSELFRTQLIRKKYRAEVLGDLAGKKKGTIVLPLDGKEAVTDYETESFDPAGNSSTVSIMIGTGRLHQIRRHFAMIGHPVMGDPKYGTGNKNRDGMKLQAVSLAFRCPFTGREMEFDLPEQLSIQSPRLSSLP